MRRAVLAVLCAAAGFGAALAAGEPRFTVQADRGSFRAGELFPTLSRLRGLRGPSSAAA